MIEDFNKAKVLGRRPTDKEYYHAKKKSQSQDPVVQIVPSSQYYQRILDTHVATDKYMVPVFAINIFLQLCKTYLSKKSFPKTGIVVKPLISDDFNRRGQVDLVDFQSSPDGEYKWMLQYQDHLTKFCFLRPLKSKEAKKVAIEILKIFLEVGCPNILQSDNGREYTASVLKEIVSLWPAFKIVNGRPRYPQSQGSVERSNQDVKNMTRAWMVDNNSNNRSIGCYFAQFQKKSSYHSTIARTPFKVLIFYVNSSDVNLEPITLKYLDSLVGHTYMSADEFHRQVEFSLKKKKISYEFDDFHRAASGSLSKKCYISAAEYMVSRNYTTLNSPCIPFRTPFTFEEIERMIEGHVGLRQCIKDVFLLNNFKNDCIKRKYKKIRRRSCFFTSPESTLKKKLII
ncbi:hypothetical protein ABMA27_003055 [Loxostege sticticalis]|uniref:Integrase catalytic domain-containing protein n=1 Tax=Loxostege sticticalis TaxID=481309 RepID=A0ABR3HRT6_LOXSC